MTDVVVVGSGPGGLAAAVTCARAGLEVLVLEAHDEPGGGMRTRHVDGLDVDVCSAVHPLALASPFFQAFDLAARGVELVVPEASFAHPLDGGRAAIAWRDLDRTAHELGSPAWARTFRPLVERVDDVVALALGDRRGLPRPPGGRAGADGGTRGGVSDGGTWADGGTRADRASRGTVPGGGRLAARVPGSAVPDGGTWADGDRRGLRLSGGRGDLVGALRGAGLLGAGFVQAIASRRWGPEADALFAGVAAHVTTGPRSPAWTAGGLLLTTLAHSYGWPVPVGGSRAIADALLADLYAHGGRVETGREVRSLADLPRARATLWDTTPAHVARVYGARMGDRERAWRRTGPGRIGAATVELVIDGPIPWADSRVGLAPTVHLGGTGTQVRRAERLTGAGHEPRPYVLLVDPAAAVPTRAVPRHAVSDRADPGHATTGYAAADRADPGHADPGHVGSVGGGGGLRPVAAYAHVPVGSRTDPVDAVVGQLERFAPGVRDVIVSAHGTPAAGLDAHNPNLVGGDIAGGALSLTGLVSRPTVLRDPYFAGVPGVFLCSSSAPPGPGVHGMTGWHAARRALHAVFSLPPPSLSP